MYYYNMDIFGYVIKNTKWCAFSLIAILLNNLMTTREYFHSSICFNAIFYIEDLRKYIIVIWIRIDFSSTDE